MDSAAVSLVDPEAGAASPAGAPTYAPAGLEPAFAAFRHAYPAYDTTEALDALRAREYRRLDDLGQVYLDYTGGGLYAEAQVRDHMALLSSHVFGNPHSTNPTSMASTRLVEQARAYVLEYFHADPDEYCVVFTANASGALKLVGESYPFGPGGHYLLTFDNHNSVNGIREFARAKGAAHAYVPVVPPDLRVDDAGLTAALAQADPARPNLFAYPAQSNFSGVQHPFEWIARAQAQGWDVLLDAAAFAPTNRLDLSRWHPDFVDLSFYKIIGYPTGVGCLIARKPALARLHRPWFAGGTITIASVQGDGYYLQEGAAGFEDGTVNYLAIPAVEIGLRHVAGIGIDLIHTRVMCLAAWLLEQLAALRYPNGAPALRIYGPTGGRARGGTIAFSLCDPQGRIIDYRDVERAANARNISLRTGCFCNPGVGEAAYGLTRADLENCFQSAEGLTFEQFIADMDGRAVGAVRVSLGLVSNFADVYRFLEFVSGFGDSHG